MEYFLEILTKADNIPIVFMVVLILFYTGWAFQQAWVNDKLIDEGRESDIVNKMRE